MITIEELFHDKMKWLREDLKEEQEMKERGWLRPRGQKLKREDYPELYNILNKVVNK